MNNIWSINISDFLEILEEAIKLGRERGKKEGENIEPEFFEIAKKKNKMPKHLGATELNKEELLEEYKLRNLKVLDLTKKEK